MAHDGLHQPFFCDRHLWLDFEKANAGVFTKSSLKEITDEMRGIYFDLSSLFFFFFLGLFTPNVPFHIFPRFDFLSPLPKIDPSFLKGNVKFS